MQRLTLLFLPLSAFLVSCTSKIPSGFKQVDMEETHYRSVYFDEPTEDYVYKSSVDVFGKHFGGILILKKINDKDYRIVMTTEFGNKIFDFLNKNSSWETLFIVEPLNKKMVVKALRKDFDFLLKREFLLNKKFNKEAETLYLSKDKYRLRLDAMELRSIEKDKVRVNFDNVTAEGIDSLTIQHLNKNLKIGLKSIGL